MAPVEVAGRRAVRNAVGDAARRAATCACAIDGETHALDEPPTIDRRRKHAVEVVVDRIVVRPDARSRIADSVENALGAGQGRAARRPCRTTTCRSRAGRCDVHSQHLACEQCGRSFEPLDAAQLLVQQLARLVPGVRRAGHADRREPGGAVARSEADARRRARCWSGRTSARRLFAADARGALRAHGRAARRAVRATRRRGSGGSCCTARARSGLTCKAESRQRSKAEAERRRATAAFRFQYKGLYPALEEASQLSPRLRGNAGAPRRRDRLQRVRRQPAARRRGGGAVPRPHARRDLPHCRWASCSSKSKSWKLAASEKKDRRRADPRDRQPAARSWSTSGSNISRSAAGARRSPAARRSASAWPARSAAACAACCTCSTSRRSACTRATTRGCSRRCTSSATWATRCSSSSTTAK